MDASASIAPSNAGSLKVTRLPRSPLRVGAAITGVLVLAMLAAIAPRSANAVGERGALTWSQEFNASAGTSPDPTAWTQESGGWGWGNAELQNYTTNNAATDGKGNLVITARKESSPGEPCWYGSCEYTSARLISSGKFSQQYGRFEARIKVPSGVGTLPAFWMLGSDIFTTNPWPASGEIDIMEVVGHTPGTLHGSLHSPDYNAANSLTGTTRLPGGGAFSDAFHVYAVEWTPTGVTWLLDDEPYLTISREQAGERAWPFDKPFFLILNLAIGGVWPGSPNAATTFPMEMLVDYVRVYELGEGAAGLPEPSPTPAQSASPVPSPVPTSGPAPSESPPSSIPGLELAIGTVGTVVGVGGKCLSAPDTRNGHRPDMRGCATGDRTQTWTMGSDGTLTSQGVCLDVAMGSKEPGAVLQMHDCTGNAAQQFRLTAAGDLVNPQADKCVDLKDNNRNSGAQVQLWWCAGSANQKWQFTPVPTGSPVDPAPSSSASPIPTPTPTPLPTATAAEPGPSPAASGVPSPTPSLLPPPSPTASPYASLSPGPSLSPTPSPVASTDPAPSASAGPSSASSSPSPPSTAPPVRPGRQLVGFADRCLTAPDTTNGTRIVMGECDPRLAGQTWEFAADGTLRNQGACLDVAWGAHDPGAVVQLNECNDNAAQQFQLTAAGDLVNPQADKCVDVADVNRNLGAVLHLWWCVGAENQKWAVR